MALTLRGSKGAPLTHEEMDANLSGLASGANLSFLSILGTGSDGTDLYDALLASSNRVQIAADVTSLAVTEAQAPTVLGGLDLLDPQAPLTITLPAAHLSGLSTTVLRNAGSAKITIQGATPVETTLTSVQSVSGSSGAWTVTLNVASVAGISVGDVAIIRSVKPGVQAPGTYTTRPVIGALQLQFFQSGSLTTSGTTFTTSGSVFTTYASDGDFLVTGGTVREISGIGTTGGTYSGSAFPKAITDDRQYWYTMRKGTGTITISGTAVTGSSTTFTSQLNAGDIIAVSGAGMRRVASVTDDTNAVLVDSGMDVAGVAWGPITRGEVHECCAVITAVDAVNTRISYVNTCKSSYAPPINNVSAGDVTVLTTVLDYGSNSGLEVCSDGFELNRIGVVGSNGSSNVGIDVRGTDDDQAPHVSLGTKMAVVGFDYGARVSTGGMLYGDTSNWAGQFVRGLDITEGGTAWLEATRVSGVTGNGIYYGPGSYVRAADALVTGCSSHGIRGDVGGSIWFDFGTSSYNVSDNFRLTGASMIHGSGARLIGSDSGSGLLGENGGRGRATGLLALCNNSDNLSLTGSDIETTQVTAIGAGSDNIFLSKGSLNAANAGVGYAVTNNINLLAHNRLWIEESLFFGSPTAIRTTDGGETLAESAGFSGNTTDANASRRSVVDVFGYASAATLVTTPKLNTKDITGALVTDGTAYPAWVVLAHSAEAVSCPADTTEDVLYTATIPAGAMGANGAVRITVAWSYTNSANDKTLRVRFGGASGTVYVSRVETTTVQHMIQQVISNRNSASSQVSMATDNTANIFTASASALVTSAVNTGSAVDIVVSGQKETSGETLTMESVLIELLYKA